MLKIAGAIAAVLVVGCWPAEAKQPRVDPNSVHSSRPLTPAEVELIETAVKGRLMDPYTAMFDPPIGADKPKLGVVAFCVAVNSKNAYGAYTGKQMLYGTIKNDVVDVNLPSDFVSSIERHRMVAAQNDVADDRLRWAKQETAMVGMTVDQRSRQAIIDQNAELRMAKMQELRQQVSPESEAAAMLEKACRDNVM
jgi:hypothetical protein